MNNIEYSFVMGRRLTKAAVFIHVPLECFDNEVEVKLSASGRLLVNCLENTYSSDSIEDEYLLNALENNKMSIILVNESEGLEKAVALANNHIGIINFNVDE